MVTFQFKECRRKEKVKEIGSVKITTVVDNDVWKKGLSLSWGLSFHVEVLKDNKKHAILMDTSGSFEAFYKIDLKLHIKPDSN